jgi:hypothetical protein
LATTKVILEQNIDPGWFVYPLMPMLERGRKRGGGQCHNSVKTSIFKNSVSSLAATQYFWLVIKSIFWVLCPFDSHIELLIESTLVDL